MLYLPRLLHLYLKPIGCSLLDFARTLAGPALIAGLIFLSHRALMNAIEVNSWAEVGLAVLQTLAGYALMLWFGRAAIAEQTKAMREIFAT